MSEVYLPHGADPDVDPAAAVVLAARLGPDPATPVLTPEEPWGER